MIYRRRKSKVVIPNAPWWVNSYANIVEMERFFTNVNEDLLKKVLKAKQLTTKN